MPPKMIEQVFHVRNVVSDCETLARLVRASMSIEVESQNMVVPFEVRELVSPAVTIQKKPVYEYEFLALLVAAGFERDVSPFNSIGFQLYSSPDLLFTVPKKDDSVIDFTGVANSKS